MATANSGKSDIQVVRTLIKNMRQFNEIVENELARMKENVSRLGETWRDEQYRQFNEYINALCGSLKKDLRVVAESADFLENKLSRL